MVPLGENYFGAMDYIFLGATLLISLLIGLYFGYKGNRTNEDLLVGGRNMSIFPVSASVMVSFISAITIIGFPSQVYAYGSDIFMLQVVSSVGMTLSPFVFIPFFYPMKLTSINEYLEKRFNSVWIRWLASATFILQTVLLNGVVLYAPSIVLESFLGFPMWMSIVGVGVCATIYTNIGGIKAVVWTDAFQFLIMVGSMVLIVFKGFYASGGFFSTLELVNERGRMKFFDFTLDLFSAHNFWNFLFGMSLHSFMQPAVHQIQVQRYSGMPSCEMAIKAVACSPPLKLLMMTLCLLTGWALFAFYANCDPLASGKIEKIDKIVPYFVIHEMNNFPGMIGIFTSCIFCAVLSSLSSCQNSLAAVTWEDFFARIGYFHKMKPNAQANVTKLIGAGYGIIFMALAFYAKHLGDIFVSSFAVVFATAGVIYGIFFMAMFFPFIDGKSATSGGCIGLLTVLTLRILAFRFNKTKFTFLPTSTVDCPDFVMPGNFTLNPVIEPSLDEWPWKIFSLSYLFYPIVGCVITLLVGILVSLVTSKFLTCPEYRKSFPSEKYVHPASRNIFKNFIVKEDCESGVNLKNGSCFNGQHDIKGFKDIPLNAVL